MVARVIALKLCHISQLEHNIGIGTVGLLRPMQYVKSEEPDDHLAKKCILPATVLVLLLTVIDSSVCKKWV
jgi:hypothetical protein